MKRPRLTALCVLLTFIVGSGFVLSQELLDAYVAFFQGYENEFNQTEEQKQKQNEYWLLSCQLAHESGISVIENLQERQRRNANLTREDYEEAFFDADYGLHQKFAEKEKEIFPDAQETALSKNKSNVNR